MTNPHNNLFYTFGESGYFLQFKGMLQDCKLTSHNIPFISHLYIYIYIHIYTHTHIYIYTHTHTHTHIYIYIVGQVAQTV